jgi:coproporphyrinogen III oxidase
METELKQAFIQHIHSLQDRICETLERADGKSFFKKDKWERPGGGGGLTHIIENGLVFEKGGVNTSVVGGQVTDIMRKQLGMQGENFFAAGLSIVIHPSNPFVPTVHANFRYFELYDQQNNVSDSWFGGGSDLTPYYLFEEDAVHFHQTLKNSCVGYGESLYPRFKKKCDEYFVNSHRGNEARGIGGIFFDHLRPNEQHTGQFWFQFVKKCSESFLSAYLPIVDKRKDMAFDGRHRRWQEIRRGRYVEFNLIHDKGTLFGLRTDGRTESILMSLPPAVRFDYDYQPEAGSEEDKLLKVCLNPRSWV